MRQHSQNLVQGLIQKFDDSFGFPIQCKKQTFGFAWVPRCITSLSKAHHQTLYKSSWRDETDWLAWLKRRGVSWLEIENLTPAGNATVAD